MYKSAYKKFVDVIKSLNAPTYLGYNDFLNGNFFFAYQFGVGNSAGAYTPRKVGSVRFDFAFEKPPTEILQVVVYTVNQAAIIMNGNEVSVVT